MKRPMTPRGYSALRTHLAELKSSRPEIAREIETARAHGDLRENAEYHAAKDKSGMVEAKIRELEMKLAEAEVIDPSRMKDPQKVVFGVTVRIQDINNEEERLLSIYGEDESDVDRGWISFQSPLGKALIGKEVSDVVTVKLPAGSREYEVLEISVDYQVEILENGNSSA